MLTVPVGGRRACDGGGVIEAGGTIGTECPFEVEASEGSELPMKGRLRVHSEFWRETLQATRAILEVIEQGYVLSLKEDPSHYSGEIKPQHS